MNLKKKKGVTLISLIITIVILIIISGIGIYSGKEVIQNAKLESLRTNMLLIQAKAREYVEQATFQMGAKQEESEKEAIREKIYEGEALLEKANEVPGEFGISDSSTCYWVTKDTQEKWGLGEMELKEQEKYLIQFKEEDQEVEVYNTLGFEGKYSLTDINQMKLSE